MVDGGEEIEVVLGVIGGCNGVVVTLANGAKISRPKDYPPC